MTKKIYKVRCVDGKLYLIHHGVSDYIGLDDESTNEKAIIQISHYLNEQEEIINELKQRSQRQYKQLKKITDLMYERNWKRLDEMVNDWEQWEKQLEQEWGTYYGDVE